MGTCGGKSGVASRSSTPAPAQATNLSAGNRGVMPGGELEREQRLDVVGRSGVRVRVDPLVRCEQRERGALLLDERRCVENENGQGGEGRSGEGPPLLYTLDTLFAPP